MKLKICSALWGYEHMDLKTVIKKIKEAGYDGIDTWVPADGARQKELFNLLQHHELHIVAHQHEAHGSTFGEFKSSFLKCLHHHATAGPLLINSHTGRDYFSHEQHLELIDVAHEFSLRTGIMVCHETHRGRMGYSPQSAASLLQQREQYLITADLSHWTCVTESMLQHFSDVLETAIQRTRHIHARVGFEEGPQIADPRAPEWQYAVDRFAEWWAAIIQHNENIGRKVMTITTEFGPFPYMPHIPFRHQPVADLFEVNVYMKDWLNARFSQYR